MKTILISLTQNDLSILGHKGGDGFSSQILEELFLQQGVSEYIFNDCSVMSDFLAKGYDVGYVISQPGRPFILASKPNGEGPVMCRFAKTIPDELRPRTIECNPELEELLARF